MAVTIRQLDHPNELVRELRQDGVRASFQDPPYTAPDGTIDLACFGPLSQALHGVTLQIFWAGYSPVGYRHTKVSVAEDAHNIPLTISGDFAFGAALVNSAGRCVG